MKLPRSQFDVLALAQLDALYRRARRLTRDRDRAEDLVQDTFIRALNSCGNFELETYGIKPWLFRIMHNLFLNYVQRETRQPYAVGVEHLESADRSGSRTLPIDPTSFQAMDERLVRALNELPEKYRSVILLRGVQELSCKEVSYALKIPVNTAAIRFFRARQQLIEKLQERAVRTHTQGVR